MVTIKFTITGSICSVSQAPHLRPERTSGLREGLERRLLPLSRTFSSFYAKPFVFSTSDRRT